MDNPEQFRDEWMWGVARIDDPNMIYAARGGAPADLDNTNPASGAMAAVGAEADDDDQEQSETILEKLDVLMQEVVKLKRSLRRRAVISQGSDVDMDGTQPSPREPPGLNRSAA